MARGIQTDILVTPLVRYPLEEKQSNIGPLSACCYRLDIRPKWTRSVRRTRVWKGLRERETVVQQDFYTADHIRLARHRIRRFVRLQSLVSVPGMIWSEQPMAVFHSGTFWVSLCWCKEGVVNQYFCVHQWTDLQFFYEVQRWNESFQQRESRRRQMPRL